MATLRLAVGISALGLFGIPMVSAQEVCVSCTGPNAVYRCTIEKSEKLGRLGALAEKAVQTVCIKELARTGGHASCAVRRESGPVICEGEQREIPLASLLDAAKAAQSAKPPVTPAALPAPVTGPVGAPQDSAAAKAAETKSGEAKPADPKAGPPRTMQELAERTGEKSKQQLESVGDAASKTWDCVTSLFTKC